MDIEPTERGIMGHQDEKRITDEELDFWLTMIQSECNSWSKIQWWRKRLSGARMKNKRGILLGIGVALVLVLALFVFMHVTNRVFPGFDLLIGGAVVALLILAILVGT